MNLKPFFIIFVLTYLTGCASGGGTFTSKVNSENIVPMKKIILLSNAKSEYFNESLNSGFENSFTNYLRSCEIDLLIHQYDKMDLDFTENLNHKKAKFSPDGLLVMKSNGGNIVNGSGGISGTLYFDLLLSDEKSKENIWVSRLGYKFLTANMFSDDALSGERLGRQLYERLITDKVLKGCELKPKAMASN